MATDLITRPGVFHKDLFFVLVVIVTVGISVLPLINKRKINAQFDTKNNVHETTELSLVANKIDRSFADQWEQSDIAPAGPANDLAVARRLSLGLAGTIPSLEEIRFLESLKPDERIPRWVDRLLGDARCHHHLAERFARAFVGVEQGEFFVYRRRLFAHWIAEQIKSDRPYDQWVTEILTASGLWTDSPAANFFTRTVAEEKQPDKMVLAGRTSRAFLGMRIDCLQCHDDFIGNVNLGSADDPSGGTQSDFHALAAYFTHARVSPMGIRDANQTSVYEYQLLDSEEPSVIVPQVPFQRELANDAESPAKKTLRRQLADWVTHPDNRPFARSIVNRVWAIITGRPLIEPVDNIPLDGPFPAAMEDIVDDFIGNGFRLKRLIRLIAATQIVRLDSRIEGTYEPAHDENWALFPLTRIRPDQAAAAIAQSTLFSTLDKTSAIFARLNEFGQTNEFIQRFGDPGENEFDDRGETVTQRLLMLNGAMVRDRLTNEANSAASLAALAPNNTKAMEIVYLCTLTRYPTPVEVEAFASKFNKGKNVSRKQEVLDLYWALINSAEFRWNH